MTNKKGDRSKKNSAVALVEAGKLLGELLVFTLRVVCF